MGSLDVGQVEYCMTTASRLLFMTEAMTIMWHLAPWRLKTTTLHDSARNETSQLLITMGHIFRPHATDIISMDAVTPVC